MLKRQVLPVAALAALLILFSFSAAWAAEPKGLADMPDPIDPQSWKLQEDMTWDDMLPNPVINWMNDLNPDGIINPKAAGNKEPIKGALLLVDFWDRPFISAQPLHSDMLGYYFHNPDGTQQTEISYNPLIHIDEEELAQWMADFIGKPTADNHGASVDEYWRENSYGKWAIEVDAYGPFTLQGFEMEYGLDYTYWSDYPPAFRRGAASGRSGSRSLTSESVALARDNGVYLGDYDFFFILHAGYDESNAWLEFGPMQWSAPRDVPYQYGAGAKMEQIEKILTAHPEYLLSLDTRGGYNQSTAIRDAANQVRAGTFSEFKFPQADWDWYRDYSWGNAAPTRYVPWTAWLYATAAWASSGTATVPRSPANGGGNVSKQFSQQGENNGMGTYAHEFGHILSHADNYENPWAITRSPRADYWDLMSRGDRNGPFGYHARWSVPGGLEAHGTPSHMMMLSKKRAGYYDDGDVYELSVAQLKANGPAVANVVSRNIPLNNNKSAANPLGYYPWLEEYGLVAPNYYKAIELTFDAANPDLAVLRTTGWSWTAFRAGRMAVEVIDRTGYDSYCNDHGVLLSRLATGTGQTRAVVDSHLYDIDMVDYYLNGEPVYYVIGHSAQLNDSLFHAGKSFVDTGYYSGSMRQWEARDDREIVSGDTVNEFYDPYNKLHYYILDKKLTPAKYGEFLSYQVGLLHDDGAPVGGELIVSGGKMEAADPGRVATQWFTIKNTGAATDIIRVGVDCDLEYTLLNDLYAIEAGQTIEVPVYILIPKCSFDLKSVTLTAASESNAGKTGAFSASVFAANINAPAQIYLREGNRLDYVVSVVNVADEGANLFTIDAVFDAKNLIYTGYTFGPSVLAYNPSQGSFSYDVTGGQLTLDMYLARPGVLLKAESETPLVTFHFSVKDGIPAGPGQTVADSFLSNVRAYCFIAGRSSPVDAIVTKPGAPTRILLHPLGYEGGELDEATISWLIYHHLYKTGAAGDWEEIKK
ncbi:MAG: hypothetical protein LBB91_03640 [Clostridiales bacterium]|jgi:hypothetical protein|nr:hypothetical protein [Clostridiales bacterium]